MRVADHAAAGGALPDRQRRRVDDDRALGRQRQRPRQRVALVETRAQHQQQVRRRIGERDSRVMRARVAEYAEGERMILRKDALRAQRRRDRDVPLLGQPQQRSSTLAVFHARPRQHGDLHRRRAPGGGESRERRLRGRQRQRCGMRECRIDPRVPHVDRRRLDVARQRQVHGRHRRRSHLEQRAPEQMVQIARVGDGTRIAHEGLQHGDVVERLAARVLEHAEAFDRRRDLAAQHEQGRTIGARRGDGRDRVAEPGTADAQHRAELAARTRIAVRHVGGTALLRCHDGPHGRLPSERRQERVHEAAGHHEQVVDAFGGQRVDQVIGTEHRASISREISPQPASHERPGCHAIDRGAGKLRILRIRGLNGRSRGPGRRAGRASSRR